MAGLRIARLGAAALAASVILAGCSFGGAVRQSPNPTSTVTGRPPTQLTAMDAAAVAIFNAAAPQNAGTAGASAQDQIGRSPATGTATTTTPGGTAPGTGTGIGGAVQPGARNTGGGTGMTGTGAGRGTPGTGTSTGATGRGATGTGATGTGTGSTGMGTTGAGTTGPGAAGTAGTGAATGTATGTTASPGTTTPRTTSTGLPNVDWARIQSEYSTVTKSWSAVRGTVSRQGASTDLSSAVTAAVSRLGTAVSGRDAFGTAMAANDLTAYTTSLLGLYRPGVPVQINEMEYLAREVELDTESGNGEGALDAARTEGGVWASLRTTAMARNRAHARAVDADVARLQKAAAAGANLNLRSEAATLLRDLQTLSRDFLTATR